VTLPLHAAARRTHDEEEQEEATGTAVLDRVVPSYTPSLLVLVRARKRRAAGQACPEASERRLLHVAMGEQRGQESLPGAARTRAYLAELLPTDRRTSLEGAAAVRRSVEAELGRHAWAHFDCHGVQDFNRPFDSGLVLRDQILTVAALSGMRHDRAEFAFLAACSTAVGGSRVPDEVITVAAALQHSGYQNVIGTLSAVPDRFAARVTRAVYGALTHDGQLRPSESARALHNAVRDERSRNPRHSQCLGALPPRRPVSRLARMDQAVRETAMDVLHDVPKWRLEHSKWEAVGRGLEAMRRALAAGDSAGLLRAAADVEMAGPHRIAGLEDAAMLPLPEEYRERVNEMVHTLGASSQNSPLADADDDAADTHASG
jgi:hypothetical protein